MKIKLTDEHLNKVDVGEAITLTSIMTVMAIAITAVVIYRLFKSKAGSTTAPGGWKFEWK
ncbi:MAG: hypothetical protein MJ207_03880 [Bacilli bacterium]|nr:hypothetical protein [Bacilli bacterium]MCQ2794465.1 hypothetical protein [Bacilli bacterium]